MSLKISLLARFLLGHKRSNSCIFLSKLTPDVPPYLGYVHNLFWHSYSYMCSQLEKQHSKKNCWLQLRSCQHKNGTSWRASERAGKRARWRTVVEPTQSECSAVGPVLHIITCCFIADGILSKHSRGRGGGPWDGTLQQTGGFRFKKVEVEDLLTCQAPGDILNMQLLYRSVVLQREWSWFECFMPANSQCRADHHQ